MDLEALCGKLESMEWVHQQLLADRSIKEIHVPPRYEMIMRGLLELRYGDGKSSDIILYVSPFVPNTEVHMIYHHGERRVINFSN